jgi:hypothetical protein
MTADATAGRLGLPRVAAAMAVIIVLALALPYAAVVKLHTSRLRRADADMAAVMEAVATVVADGTASAIHDADLVEGTGPRPPAADSRWNAARTVPMARISPMRSPAIGADPWGNAYLVLVSRGPRGLVARVLSAGPNGLIETPFAIDADAGGDDRLGPARPLTAAAR